MGVGFAVNERITLSTAFVGSYVSEWRLDGQRLPGTVMEPLYLRFAVTMAGTAGSASPSPRSA